MGNFHDQILASHLAFINKQKLFFTASAPLDPEGHVNLSPKGGDTFRVINPKQVAYLDYIGSGNETAAHLLENGRITFMFCAFTGSPNILRLYGQGRSILPDSELWPTLAPMFTIEPGSRQIILADIYQVQTSCGFSVPLYSYTGERDHAQEWWDKKGADGLYNYMQQKNQRSLDGLPAIVPGSPGLL